MKTKHVKTFGILISIILLLTSFSASSQKNKAKQLPSCTIGLAFSTNSSDSLKLEGYLGGKLDLCIEHSIKEQNVEALIIPFRSRTERRMWQTEFWGKWTTSAIEAYRFTKDPVLFQNIGDAVDGLIYTQTADGYIGNYADDAHLQQWDIWGRKYCLLGLLAYYELDSKNNKRALESARRLADHLLSEVGPGKANIVLKGNYRGLAASSVLEPIVLLYKYTGEQKYLDFAHYIVKQWETPEGPQLISKGLENVPVYVRFPYQPGTPWTTNGQKAYEMMSCYEGLLELYTLEGNHDWLKATENTVKSIIRDEINISGSGSAYECWFHGKEYQAQGIINFNEVCVTTTWIKLCTKLLKITGNPDYADQIEKSMYNALLAGLTPDGHTFTKFPPLEGLKQLSGGQCGMELNCCGANGPRALTLYPQLMYAENKEGIFINFFEDSKTVYRTKTGNNVQIIQSGNFPAGGDLEIEITPEKEETFTIGIRIPIWSKSVLLKVNELTYEARSGEYQRLVKKWKKGDKIYLHLDTRGRVEKQGNHFAIARGPIVLARDARFHDGNVLEPAFFPNSGRFIELKEVKNKPEGMLMAYEVPLILGLSVEKEYHQPRMVKLCDYASAGNTWDEDSRFKIWFQIPFNADFVRFDYLKKIQK